MRHAFTLVELAIVLVIIGLLVGGVLVGRDLIGAAQIRAALTQLNSYTQAALAFRLKYGDLPGDLKNAAALGFVATNGTPTTWASNVANTLGDGLIMSCQDDTQTIPNYPSVGYVAFGCENAMFWNHLSTAGLISEAFTQTNNANSFQTISGTLVDSYLPKSKLGTAYVIVYAWQGINYFHLLGIGASLSNTNGSTAVTNKISPTQGFNLDAKVDDGSPITGSVMAFDDASAANLQLFFTTGAPTRCRDATNHYNMSGSVANNELCQIRFKAGF